MHLPYNWRITKYNPTLRNSQGHFLADDWTAFSDIGKSFDGKLLTYADYLSREGAYANAVLTFLADAELVSLGITQLENKSLNRVTVDSLEGIAGRVSEMILMCFGLGQAES